MTLRVGDVLEQIDRRAPFRIAAGWDAVGLQIGDLRRPVSAAAVVHELTGPVVDRALALGVDLVVTYHPLVFEPLRSITAATGAEGRSFALLEAGASVISVHTNWDAASGGTADALADALGISDAEGFARARERRERAGLGREVGRLRRDLGGPAPCGASIAASHAARGRPVRGRRPPGGRAAGIGRRPPR